MHSVDHSQLPGTLPKPIVRWCIAVLSLWSLCLGLTAFWRYALHLPYPFNFPFFPYDHLYDIWCLTPRFLHVHSRDFFSPSYGYSYQYPAPAGVFYVWEDLFGRPFLTFYLSAAVGLCYLGWRLSQHLRDAGLRHTQSALLVAFIALSSYTLWYEGIQANIEIFLFFVTAFGIFAFLTERYFLAAVLFGVAASMKIFPLALLGLFFPLRRWRELFAGIAAAIFSTIAGLWMLCPDLPYAWQKVSAGLALQRDHITLYFDDKALGFDHSLFAVLKIVLEHHFNYLHPVVFPRWMFRDYVAAVAICGTMLWIVKIRKLPLLNQIACLTICAILLPPTSYEYTVLHMYVPFTLLLVYTVSEFNAGRNVQWLKPFYACFAILFSPMSEIIVKCVNLGASIKCIALSYLLFAFLTKPMNNIERIWNQSSARSVNPNEQTLTA